MAGDALLQAATVEIFQGDIWLALVFADFVNLNDVGMLQSGDGFGLRSKTRLSGCVGELSVEDHFQSDDPTQCKLTNPVNDAHAAAAQFGEKFVAGNRRQLRVRGRVQGRNRCRDGDHRGAVDQIAFAQVFKQIGQAFDQMGKAVAILVQTGRFSKFLAKDQFVPNQFDKLVRKIAQMGVYSKIGLHPDRIARFPAGVLIDQHRRDFGWIL